MEGHDLENTHKTKKGRRGRRTQEERSAETRRKLVDAAINVIQEWGYASLTISKVAQRAGMTNGAMQHHFASRDDLVVAVLDALYPVLEIPFDDIASRKISVADRVDTLIDLLWQIYSRPEYLVIWDIAFGTRGDAPLKAKLQSYQRDISGRMLKQLAAIFSDTGLAYEGAEQTFTMVISCLRGLALQTVFGVSRRRADLDSIKDVACQRIAALSRKR